MAASLTIIFLEQMKQDWQNYKRCWIVMSSTPSCLAVAVMVLGASLTGLMVSTKSSETVKDGPELISLPRTVNDGIVNVAAPALVAPNAVAISANPVVAKEILPTELHFGEFSFAIAIEREEVMNNSWGIG